jgi:hypothetical protein
VPPATLWRQWRRLPTPAEERFPSRIEAVEMGFAIHAAGHERTLADIAEAFASRGQDGKWTKS